MATKVSEATGVPGLSIWRGVLSEEYLTALKGAKRFKIFREMADDVVIATGLEAVTMPLIAAEFSVIEASKSDADQRAAYHVEECMYDMTRYSWRQHVLDMLTVMTYGWALSEIVMKKRMGLNGKPPSKFSDGKLGIHILDPRGQETLERWDMDDEYNVEAFEQRDPVSGQFHTIEAWKLLHATFRSRKRNPEGQSPLKSLYKPWYMRKNLEMIEAIGAERDLAGLPLMRLPFGATADDKTAAEKIVRNVRMDEEAGIVLPPPPSPEPGLPAWGFELLSGGGKSYNTREIIRDLNKLLLMRWFAQFLLLGMEQVGTQSLVKGSQDFFSLALKSVQQELLEMWNQQLVPFLFRFNPIPGMTDMPIIDWADAGKADVAAMINMLSQAIGVNLVTPSRELEDWVRATAGLPDRPEGVGEGPRAMPQPAPLFVTKTFQDKASNKRAEQYISERSCMVAVQVPPSIANRLIVPGGLEAEDLHITLTYHGEILDDDMHGRIKQIVHAVCGHNQPLTLTLSGTDTFPKNEEGEIPFFAKVKCPELLMLRSQLTKAFDIAGIPYLNEHEYHPHVTLKYLRQGDASPQVDVHETTPINHIDVYLGGSHYSFLLGTYAQPDIGDVHVPAVTGGYTCECTVCGYRVMIDQHCTGLRCPLCGSRMRRLERPGPGQCGMTVEDWKEAYEKGLPHWAVDLSPSLFAQDFVKVAKESDMKTILEIGCGNGRDSILFARAGFDVSAIDVAPGAIKLAKRNAEDAGVEIDFRVAEAERLPLADTSCDGVFALSVLHSTDMQQSMKEISRVLRLNGKMFVYIYLDTQYISGDVEKVMSLDDFVKLLKSQSFQLLDFYDEQEDEFDEFGEKHKIVVVLAQKK